MIQDNNQFKAVVTAMAMMIGWFHMDQYGFTPSDFYFPCFESFDVKQKKEEKKGKLGETSQ